MSLDYLTLFLEEAEEQLDLLETLLLQLEEKEDLEILDAIFRVAHTLKGSAACVGLHQVSEFAHRMESLLDKLRKAEIALGPHVCSLLLQGRDVLRSLITAAREGSAGEIGEEAVRWGRELEGAVRESLEIGRPQAYKYLIHVELDPASPMREARAFVLLKRLEELGNLEASLPEIEELLRGGSNPQQVKALLHTEINEEEVKSCLVGYPDVVSVEVMYAINFDLSNWDRCKREAEILSASGKKVVWKLERGRIRLDLSGLHKLASIALSGYNICALDPLFEGLLRRMVFYRVEDLVEG
ncbi:MAG: Hpt domain-containing protein [Moorellaceae bacterium]